MKDNIQIEPSSAKIATGNGAPVAIDDLEQTIQFVLQVTATATEVGDTCDVFIQTSPDNGVTWIDIVHFTQLTGTLGAKTYVAKVSVPDAQAMYEVGVALAAGSVRNNPGRLYRARWVVVDVVTTGNRSFTFGVVALAG